MVASAHGKAPAPEGSRFWRWTRRIALVLVIFVVASFFALTDSAPIGEEMPAPTPMQAGAGRDAVLKLKSGIDAGDRAKPVRLGPQQLDGISALASHGFRPDRLDISVRDSQFRMLASHELPWGRWLNITATTKGKSEGFPSLKTKIGSVPFSPSVSRWLAEAGRLGANAFGAGIPPLNKVVRSFAVEGDSLLVALDLPSKSALIDGIISGRTGLDAGLVRETYCRLVDQQSEAPTREFAQVVRLAFPQSAASSATTASNKAAFIALAMVIVDARVGLAAGVDPQTIEACRPATQRAFLHNRSDLPKHWALSAAIEASAGSQLAAALGEWKELADTLPRQSAFQTGAGSGFSFIDIAADRSGFRIAEQAGRNDQAKALAERLSSVTQEQLLPTELLELEEGRGVNFSKQFGSLDDERYRRAIAAIDDVLDRKSVLAAE